MAVIGTRRIGATASESAVRCRRRIGDRSPRHSHFQSAEPAALAALVRLLARQAAHQWLQAVEPTDVQDHGSAQPADCNDRHGQNDVE